MTRNMGTLDRGARAFIVAPAAIVVAYATATHNPTAPATQELGRQ